MDKQLVELADRYSRKRAVIAVIAAVVFLAMQWVVLPQVFLDRAPTARVDWWAVNALVLLAILASGGGLLNARNVRALVHDDLSRSHLRSAIAGGYWLAMGLAFLLYLAPWFHDLTGRQAIYVIVTASVAAPLLTFAFLEHRAHQDG